MHSSRSHYSVSFQNSKVRRDSSTNPCYPRLTSCRAAKISLQQWPKLFLACRLCDGRLATKNTKTHKKSGPTIEVSAEDTRANTFVPFCVFCGHPLWVAGEARALGCLSLSLPETSGCFRIDTLSAKKTLYSPKVRPQTVIRETVGEMVDLLFGGETLPLMKHLVEERKFSPGDIDQLRQLLDRLEGGSDAK
jgi:hypothetical protein